MNSESPGNDQAVPPLPPPGYAALPAAPAPPAKSRLLARIVPALVSSVLILSLFFNFYAWLLFKASASGPSEQIYQVGDVETRIVILPIKGLIDDSTTGFVRSALQALSNDTPQALILRIDSGGGTVGGSDRTYHALMKFKQKFKIPIVASFGSYAASGGYYVALPADYIFVEPTTITGSIGVMGGAFTAKELLDKVGIKSEILTATQSPEKDAANTMWRDWTDRDRKVVRNILDQAYDRFVEVVAEGRSSKLTLEQAKAVASGAVYTASEAIANGLVDESGYLDAAIEKAAQLAGLDPTKVQVGLMVPRTSALDLFTGGRVSTSTPISAGLIRQLLDEMRTTRFEYRMPPLQ